MFQLNNLKTVLHVTLETYFFNLICQNMAHGCWHGVHVGRDFFLLLLKFVKIWNKIYYHYGT